AVSEVQQLQDPVDHRVSERDQGVDAAEDDPVDAELEEKCPARRRRDVNGVEQPGDEDEPESAEVAELLSVSRIHAIPTFSERKRAAHLVMGRTFVLPQCLCLLADALERAVALDLVDPEAAALEVAARLERDRQP